MHYIRLLRPPKLVKKRSGQTDLDLKVNITTDLSDAFAWPDNRLKLGVWMSTEPCEDASSATAGGSKKTLKFSLSEFAQVSLFWKAGMRALPIVLPIPEQILRHLGTTAVRVCVHVVDSRHYSFDGLEDYERSMLRTSPGYHGDGLILPVWATLSAGQQDLSTRVFFLNKESDLVLDIKEDIGESMARHIWDGGVVALYFLRDLVHSEGQGSDFNAAMHQLFTQGGDLNILEVGCGVGITGLGLATLLHKRRAGPLSILLTDLDDAEERARTNIQLLQQRQENDSGAAGDMEDAGEGAEATTSKGTPVDVLYENLDWMDGQEGIFGPLTGSRTWHLVVISDCTYNIDTLPALVGTLDAIHAHNRAREQGSEFATKVFVTTKPRHESERMFFTLMDTAGWRMVTREDRDLPRIGQLAETVEMYLFSKS